MNRKTTYTFILLLYLFFLIISCRKPDVIFPDFTIDKPYELSMWSVGDTIDFQITLKTLPVNLIDITIVNTSMMPVSPSISFTVEDNNNVIKGKYIINNMYLETDIYYFRVRVADMQNNITSRFVKIHISEMPLQSIALFILAKHNDNVYNIYRCDTINNCVGILSLNTDYIASAINSRHGYLYVCGRYTGPLAAYDINNEYQLAWKEDALTNPPFPWFEGMSYDGKYLIAGYNDFRVKGFYPDGTTAFVFQLSGILPNTFLRHYNSQQKIYYLIIAGTNHIGTKQYISVHFALTNAQMQYLETDFKILKLLSRNNDDIYLFGNRQEQAVMKIYRISQNYTYEPVLFPGGRLFDAIAVRQGINIISLSGGLFIYNDAYVSLFPYGNFTGGGNLTYDANTDKIYYAKNNTVYVIDYLTQNIEATAVIPDSIVSMHILYNK